MTSIFLRAATRDDIPVLRELIECSVRELQAGWYTPEQIEAAVHSVFGVDQQLIDDGTYYVAEIGGQLAGCGGVEQARHTLRREPLRSFAERCDARSRARSGTYPRILYASEICPQGCRPRVA